MIKENMLLDHSNKLLKQLKRKDLTTHFMIKLRENHQEKEVPNFFHGVYGY